jgi:hypothetical protein
VLLKKFFNVGFGDIAIVERRGLGLNDIALYPLFTSEFIDFLRRLMSPERHAELVQSIVIVAHKPTAEGVGIGPI